MFNKLKETILGPIGFILFSFSKKREEKKALKRTVPEILDGMDKNRCNLWKTDYRSKSGNHYSVEFRRIKLDQSAKDYFDNSLKHRDDKFSKTYRSIHGKM